MLQKIIVFGKLLPRSLTSSISQSKPISSFFTLVTENRKLALLGLIKIFVQSDLRHSCLHMFSWVGLSAVPVEARIGTPKNFQSKLSFGH